jgi:hypothetical protein
MYVRIMITLEVGGRPRVSRHVASRFSGRSHEVAGHGAPMMGCYGRIRRHARAAAAPSIPWRRASAVVAAGPIMWVLRGAACGVRGLGVVVARDAR